MVSSLFEIILKDFESFFQCSLQPDENNSCLIKLASGISIQIELNRQGQLLVGCRLGSIPMSRYRDNLIREALKFNEATFPSTGVFGFSQKSSQLILYMLIPPHQFNSASISKLMPPFIAKARKWKEAIAKGETPTIQQASSKKMASGLFDLIS